VLNGPYTNINIPGVTTIEEALDIIIDAISWNEP